MSKTLNESTKPKEPIIWTSEMQKQAMQEYQEAEQMAQESMDALNEEQGVVLEPASEPDLSDSSEIVESEELADDINDNIVVEPESASVQELTYNNIFAKFIGSFANMVGPDTELGKKLSDFADSLDDNGSLPASQEQTDAPLYHDLNDPDVVEFIPADNKTEDKDKEDPNDDLQADKSDETSEMPYRKNITSYMTTGLSGVARLTAEDGVFLKAGQSDANMDYIREDLCDIIRKDVDADTLDQTVGFDAWDDGSPQKQHAADVHMSVMRGFQAYNDTAKETIEKMYADNPSEKEQALTGLRKTMGVMAGMGYDMTYENNRDFNFLSDADKIELDNMKFEGIDMTYSDYVANRDGVAKPDASELDMYANAGIDDALDTIGSNKQDTIKLDQNNKNADRIALVDQKLGIKSPESEDEDVVDLSF